MGKQHTHQSNIVFLKEQDQLRPRQLLASQQLSLQLVHDHPVFKENVESLVCGPVEDLK
jgi:hypothetical protein